MKHFILLLSAIALTSCHKEKAVPITNPIKDSLTSVIQKFYGERHFTGVGVAVSDENGVLYSKGFGYANTASKKNYTEQTMQTVGSVSKTFIGLSLLKAQEMGKLNLNDDVNKFLSFRLENPNAKGVTITIRHLATHTSGINDTNAYLQHNYILFGTENSAYKGDEVMNKPGAEMGMEGFLKEALVPGGKYYTHDAWGKYKPGNRYAYSNFGAATAALIIEKATGMKYDAFVEKYILQPLKMTHTHFNNKEAIAKEMSVLYADSVTAIKPYQLVTYPDGALASTAGDMGIYLTELIKGYKGKGTLLKPESYRLYFRQNLSDGNFAEPRPTQNPYDDEYNTGLFIAYTPAGYIGHTGGDPGVASMMFFNPKTGSGYFIMVNTGINNKAGMKAFYGIYDALVNNAIKLP